MAKNPKRPRDPNQLAKMIADIATGDTEDQGAPSEKNAAARELGAKGGTARARTMTPEQRSEVAKKAAAKRWNP